MTTTSYINRTLIENVKLTNFRGTFASDNIPPTRKCYYRESFIVNLDESNMPGSHWIAITFRREKNGSRSCFYFDPLADQTINANISIYISKFSDRICRNVVKIQDDKSVYCGLFCMAFVMYVDKRANKCEPNFTRPYAKKKLLTNDRKVVHYILKQINK